jgi:hypothetical protein
MFSAVRDHVIGRIEATPVGQEPFEHLYVEEVFPADFYAELQRQMIADRGYRRLNQTGRVSERYSSARLCLFPGDLATIEAPPAQKDFWRALFAAFNSSAFRQVWLRVFKSAVNRHLTSVPQGDGTRVATAFSEVFLMRDLETYALGPHTDSAQKLVSVLFYLAPDASATELGTSLYRPRDRQFTCPGGPHHGFGKFERVATLPYRPNAMLAFPKSRVCFHGVEPVASAKRRDLLLFDIKVKWQPAKTALAAAANG